MTPHGLTGLCQHLAGMRRTDAPAEKREEREADVQIGKQIQMQAVEGEAAPSHLDTGSLPALRNTPPQGASERSARHSTMEKHLA